LSKVLTAAAVAKYRASSKHRVIRDAGARSLYLTIAPSGAKSWLMRFRRPDGRPAKIVLGPLHNGGETPGPPVVGMPLTLQGARQLAAEIHRQRALGADVVGDHKARKHRQRAEIIERNGNTFAAAVRAYVDEHARPKTRNWRETAHRLGLDYADENDDEPEPTRGGLVQRWADRDVRSIDGHDIWSVTDEARRLGIPGIVARNDGLSDARGRALFVALSSFFSWLKRQRRIDSNPCAGEARPTGPASRDRVLTADEIRWLWQATDQVGEPFGAIFKLLLLTGSRLDEVAGMMATELQDDGTWHLPGARTKNKRAHMVPLPPLAREIIANVNRKRGAVLIFTITGTTPVSGWSRAKSRLDDLMLALAKAERRDAKIEPFRLHDLRRTFVTGLVELGVPPHVVELAVNHVSGTRSGVAGVYNRSEMMPERKAALERWAAHIIGLVSVTDNVVTLPPRQAGAV
jgi:integrase